MTMTIRRDHLDVDLGEVVRRAQVGDLVAAEAVARRACTSALRTAGGITGSREIAHDIAQDVAVDVLRSLGGLRDPAAFDAWVHRIAVRHALRFLRIRRMRNDREVPLADLEDANEPAAPVADGAARVAVRESLTEALAALPPRQRVALALRYVHDLTDREIATALRCRRGTANALLSRARAALRASPALSDFEPTLQGDS
jgi:RNA polymerase sigma-70 factor (ECF subfamily)